MIIKPAPENSGESWAWQFCLRLAQNGLLAKPTHDHILHLLLIIALLDSFSRTFRIPTNFRITFDFRYTLFFDSVVNIIRLAPPLIITDKEMDECMGIIEKTLIEFQSEISQPKAVGK